MCVEALPWRQCLAYPLSTVKGLSYSSSEVTRCTLYKHLAHMAVIIRFLSYLHLQYDNFYYTSCHTIRDMAAQTLKDDEVLVENPRNMASDVRNHFGFVVDNGVRVQNMPLPTDAQFKYYEHVVPRKEVSCKCLWHTYNKLKHWSCWRIFRGLHLEVVIVATSEAVSYLKKNHEKRWPVYFRVQADRWTKIPSPSTQLS